MTRLIFQLEITFFYFPTSLNEHLLDKPNEINISPESPNELRTIHLYIFLYVLTSEGVIRRVPRNQVLGLVFVCVSFCAMLVVLVVSERRASACLIILSAKQSSHWYHFKRLWYGAAGIRNHDLPLPKQTLYHLRYRGRSTNASESIRIDLDLVTMSKNALRTCHE